MRKRCLIGFLLMVFFGLTKMTSDSVPAAEAQEQVDYELQPIVVTATRTPQILWQSDANVAILTGEQIQQSFARNLGEALKFVPGVSIGQYGDTGQNVSLGIRGSTAGQVLILVDGVPVNDPQLGGLDLNTISLDNIDRVEIVRGAASALYGADAVGGVVNIITRSASYETPFSVVSYQQGKFGYDKISGRLARRLDPRLGLNIIASKTSCDGFRDNGDHESQHLDGRLGWDLGEGNKISYSSQLYDAETGIPGMDVFPTPNARQDDKLWNQALFLELPLVRGQHISAIIYRNYSQQRYQNSDLYTDAKHRRWTYGAEIQDTFPLTSRHRLTLGGDAQSRRLNSSESGRKNLSRGSIFAQDEFTIHRSLRLRAAARYDYSQRFESQLTPDVTVTWLPEARGAVFVSVKRSYRAPTFNELYWPNIAYDYDFDGQSDYREGGNDQIKPEKGVTYQLGARSQRGVLSGDVCVFRREMKDLIQWDDVDPYYLYGYWMPVNKSEASFQGFELNGVVQLTSELRISLSYTFLEAVDDLLDKELPYQPRHHLGGHVQHGIILIPDHLEMNAQLEFEYLGERFADSWESERLPSATILDAKMTARVMNDFQIYLAWKNLGDESYSLRSGYPLPGRSYLGGLTWEFWD